MPPALPSVVCISLLDFVHGTYPTEIQLLSTTGNLIHSSRFCPNLPLSSPHLPSGFLAPYQLLPWNVSCIAMEQFGTICYFTMLLRTFPNVPTACALFSQQDIELLESRDRSLKFLCICDSIWNMVKPSKPGWDALKFSAHQDDHREPVDLNERISGREKRSLKLLLG